jgi:hypothetical protein
LRPADRLVLALEGHDGSGKTTLARLLAERLDAVYVRPYGGPEGDAMLAAAERGEYELAFAVGRAAADAALAREGADRVVCDRLWLTVFTLVPPALFAQWGPRAPTAVCWADLATTEARLGLRDEAVRSRDWHERYLERYRRLATRFDCPVVRTDVQSEQQALQELELWARVAWPPNSARSAARSLCARSPRPRE